MFWLLSREVPQSNNSIDASTGKQPPIGTPSQCKHRASVAGVDLEICARCRVPEPDDCIISAAGDHAPVGGKGDVVDAVAMPTRPEQVTTIQIPQLEGPVKAPRSQYTSIRTKGEGHHRVAMRLPSQVQNLPSLPPYLHFPPPSGHSPVLPVAADG